MDPCRQVFFITMTTLHSFAKLRASFNLISS